ncbi:MAG: DUF898 family protein [Rhodobacteraceae bacterium]|nr:DUF898 family protein [Paracoccaceae bacterium]
MPDQATAHYTGARGALFSLALKTSVLTFLTLGIYRFWAKTRIRKYIWSSIQLAGDRLEYTGTGLEKFLGFLVAVVVLAVYLGLVQLILFFFGLHFVIEPQTDAEIIMQLAVFYISFLALVPLILFASYRARRYIMARTRFRGIRFGMDAAALGYVWRAIGHYLLTLVTLGVLLPRQTFWLEKYKTDRTHFGDVRFQQNGKWTALYGAMKGYLVFFVFAVIIGGITAMTTDRQALAVGLPITMIFLALSFYAAMIYYNVNSFRYLTTNKTAGGKIAFSAAPRTGRVIGILVVGLLIIGLAAVVLFAILGGLGAMVVGGAMKAEMAPGIGSLIMIAVLYLLTLAFFSALALVFISQPILAHFTDTTTVLNLSALDAVGQRAADKGADAEGFADALDVGAAF